MKAEAPAEPNEDPIAATGVATTLTMPAEDGAAAAGEGDSVQLIAEQDLSADSPVNPSAAFLGLLAAPVSTPQPTAQAAAKAALLAAAAAGVAIPDELAPSSENDAANVEADAAARQAAAAQALAAALPAPRTQFRPVDAAPLKGAPANASTDAASETDEAAPRSSTTAASSENATAAGLSGHNASPAASPAAQHAALAPSPAVEAAVTAAVPTHSAAGAAPPSATASAPAAPVTVTNASNLSQVTVETTVQIAAQITRRLEGRSTRFEMGMTPEGLGRVNISLDIDSGGKLTARLAFDNPLAATEMRGKADELRRELQDAGFTIANDGLEFSERQSSRDGGFDRDQGRAFAGASRINADADLIQPAPAAWVSLSLTPRGVDMKV